jgi:hypothetical protein
MNQGEPVNILLLENDPAHAEAVQRAILDSAIKTEVRFAETLPEG